MPTEQELVGRPEKYIIHMQVEIRVEELVGRPEKHTIHMQVEIRVEAQ